MWKTTFHHAGILNLRNETEYLKVIETSDDWSRKIWQKLNHADRIIMRSPDEKFDFSHETVDEIVRRMQTSINSFSFTYWYVNPSQVLISSTKIHDIIYLAKLLNAADCGFIQSGTLLLLFNWSDMNLCISSEMKTEQQTRNWGYLNFQSN